MVEEQPGVTTLAALRAILAPGWAPAPSEEPEPPAFRDDAVVPLVVALLAIGSGVLGAAVLVAALARRRTRSPRG
ncbi:MAG TPA: hypothetical protein VKB30_07910 [Candidatus Limnocylindrales bacterium]|nr:hypothetical protein [Candidatus Limnocylindrales bacterium]